MTHSLWHPDDMNNPPIFDIFPSKFISPAKCTKILFVSAEKSRQDEVSTLMKTIFQWNSKSIPKWLHVVIYTSSRNHSFYSIRTLLQSIPAMEGMSRPQLFQQVEPNFGAVVTIVTYQAVDHDVVISQQSSLESEPRHIIANDEDENLFIHSIEGIWFGGVKKSKLGNIAPQQQCTKDTIAYAEHLHRIMNSPPKKRPVTPSKRGGGAPHFVPRQTQHHNTQYSSSFAVTPQPTTTPTITNSTISNLFDAIQFELNQQRECNASI